MVNLKQKQKETNIGQTFRSNNKSILKIIYYMLKGDDSYFTSNEAKKVRWCRRGESNPHEREARRILNPLRLPIPPLRL